MEGELLVLKLFLEQLGVQLDLSDVAKRKDIQKAVYLGQLSGVDLGYRYGWYKKGPYSSILTSDYYALDRVINVNKDAGADMMLEPEINQRIAQVKPLLTPPENFSTRAGDWLETVASYHFLRRVRGMDDAGARQIFASEKPRLIDMIDAAKKQLERFSLLSDVLSV